jgi:hypothetical protein
MGEDMLENVDEGLDGPEPKEKTDEQVQVTGLSTRPQPRLDYRPSQIPGVVVGVALGRERDEGEVVEFTVDGVPRCMPVRKLNGIQLTAGQKVVLAFENSDPRKPLIIGCLAEATHSPEGTPSLVTEREQSEAFVDGRKIAFTAEEEIVLNCGKASITLTRAGKVIIRGEYVVSRSTGVNAITGGVVRIN